MIVVRKFMQLRYDRNELQCWYVWLFWENKWVENRKDYIGYSQDNKSLLNILMENIAIIKQTCDGYFKNTIEWKSNDLLFCFKIFLFMLHHFPWVKVAPRFLSKKFLALEKALFYFIASCSFDFEYQVMRHFMVTKCRSIWY